MGKIVKFCAKCEEGFAAKFGFCPNCGEALEAFEMNPLQAASATASESPAAAPEIPVSEPVVSQQQQQQQQVAETVSLQNSFETLPKVEEAQVPFEPTATETEEAATVDFSGEDVLELDSVDVADDKTPAKPFEPTVANDGSNGHAGGFVPETETVQSFSFKEKLHIPEVDDSFRVTVIDENNNADLRNRLLGGLSVLAVFFLLGLAVWAIFNAELPVYALELDDDNFAFVGPVEPQPVEIEKPEPKNDKEGGGGGGGGKERDTDVSKGRLPTQMENPPNPLMMIKPNNSTLKYTNATKGNIERQNDGQPIGLPDGLTGDNLSSGRGKGDGIGNGRGNGAGNGIGDGEGNGNGSGSGNGDGNGNGDGKGDGDDIGIKKPTVAANVPKVTTDLKILSRPQARYTDAARQNNVQGKVVVKVTFTASGTIGSVVPVSGLPYGLTEQAIAAAKQIRFEPKKVNGVPIAAVRTIEYTFTIY